MKAQKNYNDSDSQHEGIPTNGLTLVSGLFIIFILGSLFAVSALTSSIRDDVAWVAPATEVQQETENIAQRQYSRARLANVPEHLTNADEIEREKIQKGKVGRDELRGDVVSELLSSD
jgi:hypothetical protein